MVHSDVESGHKAVHTADNKHLSSFSLIFLILFLTYLNSCFMSIKADHDGVKAATSDSSPRLLWGKSLSLLLGLVLGGFLF